MPTFSIGPTSFLLDEQPFRILAGAMHYFRVHPACWQDRLQKLRSMGLNTLETYVAWNLHEPQPGQFNFTGWLDLPHYLELAADAGLYVMIRPGPYICSEWDLGGLPAWLLRNPAMRLRCCYPPYLAAVDRFFDALIPRLAPFQVTRGGPLLACQVENEYGSYGNDTVYLQYLADGLRARGLSVPLFTSDGPTDDMLQGGTLPGVLRTVNFGSGAGEAFQKLRQYQPDGPLMVAEFWNGWFDHWGEAHHTRQPQDAAAALDEILAAGGSVSLYMGHGGTNFGFMNGANWFPQTGYQPTVTSYDDDAPLDEAGQPTPKYAALREVIGRYAVLPQAEVPPEAGQTPSGPTNRLALGEIELTESVRLLEALPALSAPVRSNTPEPMEAFGQNYGFILYRTRLSGPRPENRLTLYELHDRAQVFSGGRLLGVLEREHPDLTLNFSVPAEGLTLDILVENMGRVNYGPVMAFERKGITHGALFGLQFLYGWEIFPLPLDNLAALVYSSYSSGCSRGYSRGKVEAPAFFRGHFEVTKPLDTFLALPGWTKGVAWINGFNLGRYWARGPQQTLYIPAPLLCSGQNELVILELEQVARPVVELRDHPTLG